MNKGAKLLTVSIIISTLILSLIAFPFPASAQKGPGEEQVIGVFGKIPGKDLIVHILVVLPPGADKSGAVSEALRQQGAVPWVHDEFSTTVLVWDQFSDSDPNNNSVTQYYNSNNDPTGNGGLTALSNTYGSWNGVATSIFEFSDGGSTDRCPSLVRECEGKQTFDGNNDVAWLELRGCCTLGVTWFGTSIDEADMALNTKFSWSTDGVNHYDAQTVFLHENGHVVGLGHSEVKQAVMYASYQEVRQKLHQDDIDGIAWLYPSSEITDDIVAPTVVSGETSSSTSIELTMSETVTSTAVAADFTIVGTLANGGPTISVGSVSASGSTVTLSSLGADLTSTDDIKVDYTKGTGSVDDESGNSLADFADQSVTNNLGTSSSTVNVSSITYDTEGGKFQDKHLLITVSLVDGSNISVSGASVLIDLWFDNDGSETKNDGDTFVGSGSGTTGDNGSVTFTLKNAPAGCYTTEVTSISAGSLTWDRSTLPNGDCK